MTAQEDKKFRGRPTGTVGTKISKLRRISNRLESMARTQAMAIVQESLDGGEVDKEKLATAKWTVTAAKEFHKACLSEEEARRDLIEDARAEAELEESEKEGAVVFQLHMPK